MSSIVFFGNTLSQTILKLQEVGCHSCVSVPLDEKCPEQGADNSDFLKFLFLYMKHGVFLKSSSVLLYASRGRERLWSKMMGRRLPDQHSKHIDFFLTLITLQIRECLYARCLTYENKVLSFCFTLLLLWFTINMQNYVKLCIVLDFFLTFIIYILVTFKQTSNSKSMSCCFFFFKDRKIRSRCIPAMPVLYLGDHHKRIVFTSWIIYILSMMNWTFVELFQKWIYA